MQTDTQPESLSGLIERVTFFNEENGFSVLKVKAKNHRDEITVVGSLPSVSAGEWLTAEGRWIRDREFGLQFKAHLLRSSAPTTREGIEKYLGSGMVKGIGPVYAKKLVAKFGEQIFHIIESESGRLQDVQGIGPMRRQLIKNAWAEQKVIRDIMVFLHSNGVSTSRAVRIYKTYGENAIKAVRENPYRLARDIHGIGFQTADQIAQKIGIPHESLLRACAGLSHVLQEAMGQGHCALPTNDLKEAAHQLLDIPFTLIDSAVARTLQDQELVQEQVGDEEFIYLPWLKRAEETVADSIKAMVLKGAAPGYPPIDFEKAVAWCEARTQKQLAPTQRKALQQALTSRALIITGGPGVGKTTLVNAILLILTAKKVRCLLCAPTGRAAKRLSETTGMEAKTVHRLLEVAPGTGRFLRNSSNPLPCDLLVVDESSMLDMSLMSHLLSALPRSGNLLLVGDVDQLPSVGPGSVLKSLIESNILPVARLREVFRQAANSHIITNAHRINEGLLPEIPEKEIDSDFYFIERDQPEAIVDTLLDVVKNRIPKKFGFHPVRDTQVLCPMNRGSLGIRELNLRLQTQLNPSRAEDPSVEKFGTVFRVGDKVIQTENNYDKEIFNGDIGHVAKIDPAERELSVQYDKRLVTYEFGELDELALAYAITIHKSQGSEFPVVVIPLATQQYMLLQRNLLYTAVTRGKRLVIIIGQKKAASLAIANNRLQTRFSGLLTRLRTA